MTESKNYLVVQIKEIRSVNVNIQKSNKNGTINLVARVPRYEDREFDTFQVLGSIGDLYLAIAMKKRFSETKKIPLEYIAVIPAY